MIVNEALEKRTIRALVNATESNDEETCKCAQQALLELKDQPSIEELCKIYLQDKKETVWRIINQKGFAPQDIKERVIFYLKTNQRLRCLTLGKEAIRPLVTLLSDSDDELRKKAEITLLALTNQAVIDELCQVYLENENEALINIIKKRNYAPSSDKVLFYLKTNQPQKCLLGGKEFLWQLVQLLSCQETTSKAKDTLKIIEDNSLKEELCQIYFETLNSSLEEILKDKIWTPHQSEDKALFYLFSNQWNKYFELDVKSTLVKKAYEKANLKIKRNLVNLILRTKDEYFFNFLIDVLQHEDDVEIIKVILNFIIQNNGHIIKLTNSIFPYLNDNRLKLFIHILKENDSQVSSQLMFELIKRAKKGYLTLKAIKILEDRNWKPVTQLVLFEELSQIRKKVFDYHLQLLTKNSSPASILALGELGDRKAIDELIKALEFNNPLMRKNAAIALGEIGDKTVNKYLRKVLNDESSEVRIAAAQGLLRLEDKETVPFIIQALKDREWRVRSKAVQILGLLQYKRAIELLIEALEDTEWEVKENACWSLGYLKDKRAIKPLIKALSDRNLQVRAKAAWSLGEIGDKAAIYPLECALKDERWEVRVQAFHSLGKLGDRKVIGTLRRYLQDISQRVRIIAAYTLIILGDTSGFNTLIKALSSKKVDVRRDAVVALGELGDKRALEFLITALNDEDWKVRCEAAKALAKIRDIIALGPLIRALNDNAQEVRIASAQTLSQLGDTRVLRPLLRGLVTKPRLERRAFVQALTHIGNEEVVESLVQILPDEDTEGKLIVTDAICHIIGYLSTKSSIHQINFLQQLLKKLNQLYDENKLKKSEGIEKYFAQISLLILKAQVKDIVIIHQKKPIKLGERDIVIT